jgi:D-alanyl-D-alanine carboxypeptidase
VTEQLEKLPTSEEVRDRFVEIVAQVAQRRGITLEHEEWWIVESKMFDVAAPDEEFAATSGGNASVRQWNVFRFGWEIFEVARTLEKKIKKEWEDLNSLARQAFEHQAKGKKAEPFSYYKKLRARMCTDGWPDPAQYWNEIVPGTLFGVPIGYGIHSKLLQRLKGTDESWKSTTDEPPEDLTAKPSGANPVPIADVGGFEPRLTLPSETALSNHAWGLAIDVDAVWNPYITNKEMMQVIKTHSGIDLSQDPINLHELRNDPNDSSKSAKNNDKLTARHKKLEEASTAIAAWLKKETPKENRLARALEEAEKTLHEAQEAGDPIAIDAAKQQVTEASNAYNNDPDARHIATLRILRKDELKYWEGDSFLNLPPKLIIKLKSRGFGWGGEYIHNKDFMHFELYAKDAFTGRSPQ